MSLPGRDQRRYPSGPVLPVIDRRAFLARTARLGWLALLPASDLTETVRSTATRRRAAPRLSALEIVRFEGTRPTSGRPWQWQVQPLHLYPDHRPDPYVPNPDPTPGTAGYGANYLFLRTDDGAEGVYGPVDTPACVVVDRQLRDFLIGQPALAGELVWDKLYRLNRHARTGHYMMAISAVDNALWDLRGRYFDAPVYRLLGGPTREAATVYGSTLGTSIAPDALRETAPALRDAGFRHQKWFLAHGPGEGAEGLSKNIEMVRILREAVGDETDLMFDAFMGWDLNYALAWAHEVERYRPRWIEEAFSPDKLDSFVALSRATTIPVATGEHFYNRWEVQRFLRADAIRVVQADPEWCGGVSELAKICTLASAYDAHVVPHGHNLHAALHVVASQSPMTCPLVEYLIDKMGHYYMFEQDQLTPVDGQIALPERPGFGIEWAEDRIEERRVMSWR